MKEKEMTIGQMVAEDYRTASVFTKHKIDYCCNGNRPLETACDEMGIDADEVWYDLRNIAREEPTDTDYRSLTLTQLIDHIVTTYHDYIREKAPELERYLNAIVNAHGARHPELFKVRDLFSASAADLLSHLVKEEQVLFPAIKRMEKDKSLGQPLNADMISGPVAAMMHEHDVEGQRFRDMEELSAGYAIPADACNTYRVAYKLLKEFQDKLHLHIHLENNILFPAAQALK